MTLLKHLRDMNTTAMKMEDAVETVKRKDAIIAAKETPEPDIIGTLLEYLSAMGMVCESRDQLHTRPMYTSLYVLICLHINSNFYGATCSLSPFSLHSVPIAVHTFLLADP